MSDPSIGHPILPVTAEVCKTFIVPQFLKVFMIRLYPTSAQILYNTLTNENTLVFVKHTTANKI